MDLKVAIKKMQDEDLAQWRNTQDKYWVGHAFACRDILEYMKENESQPDYKDTPLDIKYIEEEKLDIIYKRSYLSTDRLDSFIEIATHFGLVYQRAKLEEELIELLHATKRINTKSIHNYDEEQLILDFVEEAGDVLMMLIQVIWLMDIGDEVEASVDEKIKRTLQKIFLDKIEENNKE